MFVKQFRNGLAIRQLADGIQAVERPVVFKRAFYGLPECFFRGFASFRQWKKKKEKTFKYGGYALN